MAKTRISYKDRLLMGSIGNLEGLSQRLTTFDHLEQSRVQAAIESANKLSQQLKSFLGEASNMDADKLTSTLQAQSSNRSSGQESRADRCPPS